MGCGNVREKLEYQIMVLKVEKLDVIQERAEMVRELEKLTGEPVVRKPVPNYLLSEHKNDDDNKTHESDKVTSHSNKKSKKKQKKSKKKKKKKHKKRDSDEDEEEESDNDNEVSEEDEDDEEED